MILCVLCVNFTTMHLSGYTNMLCLIVRVHEQACRDMVSIFQWQRLLTSNSCGNVWSLNFNGIDENNSGLSIWSTEKTINTFELQAILPTLFMPCIPLCQHCGMDVIIPNLHFCLLQLKLTLLTYILFLFVFNFLLTAPTHLRPAKMNKCCLYFLMRLPFPYDFDGFQSLDSSFTC